MQWPLSMSTVTTDAMLACSKASSHWIRWGLDLPYLGPLGSSTSPPPSVSVSESSRMTKRSPWVVHSGCWKINCALLDSPGISLLVWLSISATCAATRLAPMCTFTGDRCLSGRAGSGNSFNETSTRSDISEKFESTSRSPRSISFSSTFPEMHSATRCPAVAVSSWTSLARTSFTRTSMPLGSRCNTSPTLTRPALAVPVATMPAPLT